MDQHPLFAYTTLAASASAAATSLTLTSATDFPDPASGGEYNAVIWPLNLKPLKSNAEVVRVTAKAGAVLTVTRAQEGSTAYAFASGDEFAVAVTPKALTDAEAWQLYTGATGGTDYLNTRVSGDSGPRFLVNSDGGHEFGDGAGGTDVGFYRAQASVLQFTGQIYAQGGVTTETKAGTPTDSDTDLDQDGTMLVDTTNHLFYYRSGGTWRAAATDAALSAHLTDTVDAHDASAISLLDTDGWFAATDVEAALLEIISTDSVDFATYSTTGSNLEIPWPAALGGSRMNYLFLNGSGLMDIKSIGEPTWGLGTRLILSVATGTGVRLQHNQTPSSGFDGIWAFGAAISMTGGGVVELVQSGGLWEIVGAGTANFTPIKDLANAFTAVTVEEALKELYDNKGDLPYIFAFGGY